MTDIEWAALIGASLSALRYLGKKPLRMKAFRVFLNGYFLAIYLGDDVVMASGQYFNFDVSKGGTVFLVSFLGAEILEKILWFIKNVNISTIWNKRND